MRAMVLHELGRGPVPPTSLSGLSRTEPAADETALVDAVEVYHRTYTTILRSSGETQLRVFEHSHKAMGSSLPEFRFSGTKMSNKRMIGRHV